MTGNGSASKHGTVIPEIRVAPGPHLHSGRSTRRVMIDVLTGLLPLMLTAMAVFRWAAVQQLVWCLAGCLVSETLFEGLRRRRATLADGSACVTAIILALSLPATAPWYVAALGSAAAIGLGKSVFGGLGQNIFNPAMVGRAFVMIAFPAALGASAYVDSQAGISAVTQATPLTLLRQTGEVTHISALFLGVTNGSLGETSALAALLGGSYLCWRRTASWRIPAGILLTVAVLGGILQVFNHAPGWTVAHELMSGALLFGAFFIATDPVSSPISPRGRWIFGIGTGSLIIIMRRLSGYPEGVMFSVLLMNALVPLINRWTIPRPVGGEAPPGKDT